MNLAFKACSSGWIFSGKTLSAAWKGGIIFSFWEELLSTFAAIPLFFFFG